MIPATYSLSFEGVGSCEGSSTGSGSDLSGNTDAAGAGHHAEPGSIYIIEDSQLDIGLLDAVRRNLERIFSILCDYLEWNEEAIEKSRKSPEPEGSFEDGEDGPEPVLVGNAGAADGKDGRSRKGIAGFFAGIGRGFRKFFTGIGSALGRLFRRKKNGEPESEAEAVPESDDAPQGDFSAEDPPEDSAAYREDETETEDNIGYNRDIYNDEDHAEPEDEDGSDDAGTIIRSGMSVNASASRSSGISGGTSASRTIRLSAPSAFSGTGSRHMEKAGIDDLEYEDEGAVKDDGFAPGSTEGDTLPDGSEIIKRKPYHERYYLLYGGREVPESIAPHETLQYLLRIGYGGSGLEQARTGRELSGKLAGRLRVMDGQHCCDFCGKVLIRGQYEVLKDGRERCAECSANAIRSAAAFRDLYEEVRNNMQRFYHIRFTQPVHVKMVNLKRLQKLKGEPEIQVTPGFDARSPAFAQLRTDRRGNREFSLYIENGCTRRYAAVAIAHELTHIWQFTYWDMDRLAAKYGQEHMQELLEGMAVWSEVQYAYLAGDSQEAELEEANVLENNRDNEYGIGYARFLKKYPISRGRTLKHNTPFRHPDRPL